MELANKSDEEILANRHSLEKCCAGQEGEFVAEMVLVEKSSRYLVNHALVY